MSNKSAKENEEIKLEDILKSIRGMIETGPQEYLNTDSENNSNKENVLELTSVVDNNPNEDFISIAAKEKTVEQIQKLNDALEKGEYVETAAVSIDTMVNDIMRPLIKEWLDNNLPKLVEKVVSEEIKRVIIKK